MVVKREFTLTQQSHEGFLREDASFETLSMVTNVVETPIAKTLDVKGMFCPLPILKSRKAIKSIDPGEILEIIATDPRSPKDIAAWCENIGHELVRSEVDGKVFRMLVRKQQA